jgi:hypothetical protein
MTFKCLALIKLLFCQTVSIRPISLRTDTPQVESSDALLTAFYRRMDGNPEHDNKPLRIVNKVGRSAVGLVSKSIRDAPFGRYRHMECMLRGADCGMNYATRAYLAGMPAQWEV